MHGQVRHSLQEGAEQREGNLPQHAALLGSRGILEHVGNMRVNRHTDPPSNKSSNSPNVSLFQELGWSLGPLALQIHV